MLGSKRLRLFFALLAVAILAGASGVHAQQPSPSGYELPQTQPNDEALGSLSRLTVSPVAVSGGGTLTLISPERWSDLSQAVVGTLQGIHDELTKMFGTLPAFATSIRLTDIENFRRATGAPGWTNALYYRGQIIIPLSVTEEPDVENLKRSIRHEYTHAVINSLSAGRAPGWLDEGLAEWMEGDENPALRPALAKWLEGNDPVPLSLMQGGFTKMESDMVPAAYAQSLFAATVVINTFGFENIRTYFDGLKQGMSKEAAFAYGFSLDLNSFERRLGKTLLSWQSKQPFTSSTQLERASLRRHSEPH